MEKLKFTLSDYQRIVVVILKNDFEATWKEIAEVLNLKQSEAKELYLSLIRVMENSELKSKTSEPNKLTLPIS